ncbi:L-fuculokinase [Halosquirtibacter xylanolyticus]|uniref:L-fuculokinase n=1 Tax=Halosquirtibacter xylanolyticus TaxID=3374599 RepID=UPI003747B4D8|nr:L-fuculokinase [Prolixibacteraceae bacterium]
MNGKEIAIVFDCGATNVKVVAMDIDGHIVASHSMSNETDKDPFFEGGIIWDMEKLWGKLCSLSKMVMEEIDTSRIVGVTVTTFGVDGTLVDEGGDPLYPIISWQCPRTTSIMERIDKYMPLEKVYEISGVYPYAFNTINKLIWFKENRAELLDSSSRFLFIPSILSSKLTGVLKNDATMLGTSMMGDIGQRACSDSICRTLGVDPDIFGEIAEPGERAGAVTQEAEALTGIPKDVPVFMAGHDTQFALIGSGAKVNQPVLSSGTWEILMTRSQSQTASIRELEHGITTELDAEKGIYNIGQNWIGSGVLEWFSKQFYRDIDKEDLYNRMVTDAELVAVGSNGVTVGPDFYTNSSGRSHGAIQGLTIATDRAELYRAFLEGLSFRLREGLEALEKAGGFTAEKIICVGGGSKNRLWNQLRADICNRPIQLIDQKETTVLGASMVVFVGSKVFETIDMIREYIDYKPQVILPSHNHKEYDMLYQQYRMERDN